MTTPITEVPFGALFELIRNGLSVRQDKSGRGLPITRIETISAGTNLPGDPLHGRPIERFGAAPDRVRQYLGAERLHETIGLREQGMKTEDIVKNHVFITAGANKLWTAMPHTRERAIRFNLGIGMKREAVLRHHFGPKAHAVICSMMRDEWARSRWRA